MKITTWNVNGLRAILNKGALDWIQTGGPDVLCLQEIKARPEQLTGQQRQIFDGYHEVWNPAVKPGYSGVATLSRPRPLEFQTGIGRGVFDQEGRVIRSRYPGFWLFNIYFPSGQRGYERVSFKLEFYAFLLEMIDQMHAAGEKIILCGDFNTAHSEIDLRHPKQNITTSGFMPEERFWIDKYLEHGLADAFRTRYPERVQYTWWTYRLNARQRNIGWRIDYFLISESLLPQVEDVIIHEEIAGSDHCPVSILVES
jgi:exodeoxyribonuclease-3